MNCDGCTMCCKLLNISWMDSPQGELCKECDEGKGCKIYDTAPKKCLEYSCAYNQIKKASTDLRPDNCNVIFEKITDDIFIGTIDPKEKRLQEVVKDQINSFLQEGFSVVLFNQRLDTPFIHPVQGVTANEVWTAIQKIMELRKSNGIT